MLDICLGAGYVSHALQNSYSEHCGNFPGRHLYEACSYVFYKNLF